MASQGPTIHRLNAQALGDPWKEMDVLIYSVLQTSHVLTNAQPHMGTQDRYSPTGMSTYTCNSHRQPQTAGGGGGGQRHPSPGHTLAFLGPQTSPSYQSHFLFGPKISRPLSLLGSWNEQGGIGGSISW